MVLLVMDCKGLPAPLNGFRVQKLTTFEAAISFSCATGYRLLGSSVRRCGADGKWDGTQTTCQSISIACVVDETSRNWSGCCVSVVDCGSLDAPRNGRKSGVATTYRSVVRFSCVTGYKLIGSTSRKCQSDGSWAGKQPICERKERICRVVPI